jgi:hypothetical protein
MINIAEQTQKYELRFNDGVINTHHEVIKQVKLMQSRLKASHCFNDLISNGKYDKVTQNAVHLMKRRIKLDINDRCDQRLWEYLLDADVEIIRKPLAGVNLSSNIKRIISIPEIELENLLIKLIAIPTFNQLNSAQIDTLMAFSFYFGYNYGNVNFEPLNTVLSAGFFSLIPETLNLYKNTRNQDLIEYLISLWVDF